MDKPIHLCVTKSDLSDVADDPVTIEEIREEQISQGFQGSS
jgi:hypothetical protein